MPEGREKTILMTDCVIGSTLIYIAYAIFFRNITEEVAHMGGKPNLAPATHP